MIVLVGLPLEVCLISKLADKSGAFRARAALPQPKAERTVLVPVDDADKEFISAVLAEVGLLKADYVVVGSNAYTAAAHLVHKRYTVGIKAGGDECIWVENRLSEAVRGEFILGQNLRKFTAVVGTATKSECSVTVCMDYSRMIIAFCNGR